MSNFYLKLINIPFYKYILAKIFLINTKIFWKYISNANKRYEFRYYKPDEYLFNFFKSKKKIGTVIEFGSGYGDLLFNIHKCDISKLVGYELNNSKVKLGNALLMKKKVSNIKLICKDITKIKRKEIQEADFFITSMTLIYLKESELKRALNIIFLNCKKGFVFQEFSSEENNPKNKTFYIHNFKKIFTDMKLDNKFKINFNHIDYEYWNNKGVKAFQIEGKIK